MRVYPLMAGARLGAAFASRFAAVRTAGRVVATVVNVGAVFAVGGLVAILDTIDVVLAKPGEDGDQDVAQQGGV